jgi:N-acetylmuramoyl-L-alanine amidase
VTYSPNSSGVLKDPQFLVVHSTISGSFTGSRDWLLDKKSKVSAHELIGRDGEWTQLVPYDKCAWHCGPSSWKGKYALNSCSIGIELVSWGPLTQTPDGSFKSALYGTAVTSGEVFLGAPSGSIYQWWQGYTPEQLLKLEQRIVELFKQFSSLKEVVGHRDISPGRKQDPWPLEPQKVFSRYAR